MGSGFWTGPDQSLTENMWMLLKLSLTLRRACMKNGTFQQLLKRHFHHLRLVSCPMLRWVFLMKNGRTLRFGHIILSPCRRRLWMGRALGELPSGLLATQQTWQSATKTQTKGHVGSDSSWLGDIITLQSIFLLSHHLVSFCVCFSVPPVSTTVACVWHRTPSSATSWMGWDRPSLLGDRR